VSSTRRNCTPSGLSKNARWAGVSSVAAARATQPGRERLTGSDGGRVAVFRPREWRGIRNDADIHQLSPRRMADEIGAYPRGTVTWVYLTSNGGLTLEISFLALSRLLPPHVQRVSTDTAARLALAAGPRGPRPPEPSPGAVDTGAAERVISGVMPLGQSFLAHAPDACRRIGALSPGREADAVADAERTLAAVRWFDPAAVASWLVADPWHAAVALAAVADGARSLVGERLAALFPELAGLAAPAHAATYEHERHAPDPDERPMPLVDHLLRALVVAARETAGLDAGHRALVTTVLLYADVAKGGDAAQRAAWARLGVDGAVHNADSAKLLAVAFDGALGGAAPFAGDLRWRHRAMALVASTGLVGMHLRGEVPREAFDALRAHLAGEPADARAGLVTAWSIVNTCDTSAVRAGLFTAELAASFRDEEAAIVRGEPLAGPRASFADRLVRLHRGALVTRDGLDAAERALAGLGAARAPLEARLERCQLWYAESALGGLSLDAATRLLARLADAAARALDTSRAWHLDLLGLVPALRDERGAPRPYPTRLLEALLAADGAAFDGASALVSFPATRGDDDALLVHFEASDEARALLTLLPIYEHKEAAAFHATLKALCDLYGLRKDDFDRVANEASYLATMNAAKSDKARMVDLCAPGTIVEVGPGGGVVLDLICERFPASRVIGLDASTAVIDSLTTKRASSPHRFEVVHGDAFALPALFGARAVTTVVYCSVLHEIFSYVPFADADGGAPRRFNLASVDAMIAATFRALAEGGRIVVRDGVTPPDEPRVLEFLDPAWREGFELFARTYEARPVPFERLGGERVRLSAPDVFEFLTTFTWGAASFPYEIREQRAVLPRAEYVARMIAVCRTADPPFEAREVPVPSDLASYLQAGYPEHILPHVRVLDGDGARAVPMPDVNGVWVLEKVRR
jgi:SAM-dependent methyltransferase